MPHSKPLYFYSSIIFAEPRAKLLTFELGKREMIAMPLLATAAAEEEDVEGKGGREVASELSPSPFSVC